MFKEYGEEPVGTISVVDICERINKVHIGYCIGFGWWNKEIMSEAFSAVISFFFNEVKVNRIGSQQDPENPASGRVMMKCGLKPEGILRKADFSSRGVVDVAVYSLLACEYYGSSGMKAADDRSC